MKRLLLTSTGLTNPKIRNEFLNLIEKNPSETKVIFVGAAARSEEEFKYVEESRKELLNIGILEDNIKSTNLDEPIKSAEIKDFDVIYICGGNTFYLLKKVRDSKFDKVIEEFTRNNGLYLGVSAGSILVCPNIDIASPWDENDTGLTDFTGLNLTDVIVSPHYCSEEKELIDDFRLKSNYEVVTLTDNQALLVLDDKKVIIE